MKKNYICYSKEGKISVDTKLFFQDPDIQNKIIELSKYKIINGKLVCDK